MPDDHLHRFDPPRLVEVERDGQWWPGMQSARLRWNEAWTASVRYATTKQTYSQNVSRNWVRPRHAQPRQAST